MPIVAGFDQHPSDHLKVEVAFTTAPDDPNPAYVDLTSRVSLRAGVDIQRGRLDQFDQAQPGRCTLTFDNVDGALTAENPSSPYYPNVLPQKRMRVSYLDPSFPGTSTVLFTGYVDEWPLEWPTGDDTYATAQVSASDMLARLGRHQVLGSVVQETALLDAPVAYFPLGEPATATAASDVTPSGSILTVQQVGTGGTIAFASGTGPPTDGRAAPTFTPASVAQGKILSGPIPPVGGTAGYGIMTFECSFATTTVGQRTIFRARNIWGDYVGIGVDSSGNLAATYSAVFGGPGGVWSSTSSVVDGSTHHAVLVTNGLTTTWNLYLDGVLVKTGTGVAPNAQLTSLEVGGTANGEMFAGTISHVAVYSTAMTAARVLEHRTAQTTGFSPERSDQRIARIASWCGIPTTAQVLDTGNATSVAHVDCTGLNPLDYMRQVETTEAGLLFIDASGRLTFFNRARTYTASSPNVTIPAALLDPPPRPVKNLLGIVNDFTGSRPAGTSVRVINQSSIDAYGATKAQDSYLLTSDSDLTDAVNWRVAKQATPTRRIPELSIEAMTDPSAGPFRAIEIGNRAQVTGLPAQVGSSTVDQIVQGYRLRISDSEWTVTANTTNYGDALAWVIEDPVYGSLDGPGVLIY